MSVEKAIGLLQQAIKANEYSDVHAMLSNALAELQPEHKPKCEICNDNGIVNANPCGCGMDTLIEIDIPCPKCKAEGKSVKHLKVPDENYNKALCLDAKDGDTYTITPEFCTCKKCLEVWKKEYEQFEDCEIKDCDKLIYVRESGARYVLFEALASNNFLGFFTADNNNDMCEIAPEEVAINMDKKPFVRFKIK